jgi:hypothetical protein
MGKGAKASERERDEKKTAPQRRAVRRIFRGWTCCFELDWWIHNLVLSFFPLS